MLGWGDKTQPECGSHNPMGQGPRINNRKKENDLSTSIISLASPLQIQWDQLPKAPAAMCSPPSRTVFFQTVGLNKLFLPFLTFSLSGILSVQWEKWLTQPGSYCPCLLYLSRQVSPLTYQKRLRDNYELSGQWYENSFAVGSFPKSCTRDRAETALCLKASSQQTIHSIRQEPWAFHCFTGWTCNIVGN